MTTGASRYLRSSVIVLSLAMFLASCARKPDTTETESSGANPAEAAAAPDLSSTAAGAIDTAAAETRAAELTQVVRKYAAEKQRAPKSLDEVVAAGYLSSVPSAPAGKAYVIDKNLQVQLADK